ncbi:MAG: hypothetical protein QM785_10495 [Pyrinomonadaceae bacterium]
METNKIKKEKAFDAVKMMRDARDLISSETKNMNAEQLKAYIKEKLARRKLQPVGR